MRQLSAALLAALLAATAFLTAAPAHAHATLKGYANCTALHATYPGGVAKTNSAAKRTTGNHFPKVSKKLYKANKHLDRDKDKIACEA